MEREKVQRMREEILIWSYRGTLFRLAYPLIVSNLVQVLYNITDTFWLGKLGREALAAPGTMANNWNPHVPWDGVRNGGLRLCGAVHRGRKVREGITVPLAKLFGFTSRAFYNPSWLTSGWGFSRGFTLVSGVLRTPF